MNAFLPHPALHTRLLAALGVGLVVGAVLLFRSRGTTHTRHAPSAIQRRDWRMPPLTLLEKPKLSRANKFVMVTMRSYLALAVVLVVVKVVVRILGYPEQSADSARLVAVLISPPG